MPANLTKAPSKPPHLKRGKNQPPGRLHLLVDRERREEVVNLLLALVVVIVVVGMFLFSRKGDF